MNDVLHRNKKVKHPAYTSAKMLADKYANVLKGTIDQFQDGLPDIDVSYNSLSLYVCLLGLELI